MTPHKAWDLRIEGFVRWYDLWIGAYYDRDQKRLYVCPIPMVGFWIEIRSKMTTDEMSIQIG